MIFRRSTLASGALTLAALAATQAHASAAVAVLLTIDDQPARGLVLEQANGILFIAEKDLPTALISPQAFRELPRIELPKCPVCIPINALGQYSENRNEATANLSLFNQLKPVKSFDVSGRPSAATVPVQHGFALINQFSLSARDSSEDGKSYLGLMENRLSLGPLGTLTTGLRYLDQAQADQAEIQRLASSITKHWVDQQLSIDVGDVRTDVDRNESGLSLLGLRFYRNFATRPDKLASPSLDFYTNLERPSVISLFQNNRQVFQREINGTGPVQISDYRPGGSGEVLLVVTDALGSERIVATDFYQDGGRLDEGLFDFGISAGVLSQTNEKPLRSLGYGVRGSYGLTPLLTVGSFLEGLAVDPRDELNLPYRYSWSMGLRAALSSSLGAFELSGRSIQDNRQVHAGYSTKLNWRIVEPLSWGAISVGATGIMEEDYRSLLGESRDLSGWRSYATLTTRLGFLSANQFAFREQQGYGASVGFRLGPVSTQLAWQMIDDVGQFGSIGLSLPLERIRSVVGTRVRFDLESGEENYQVTARTSSKDSRINLNLSGSESSTLEKSNARYEDALSARGDFVSGNYQYRYFGGEDEHLINVGSTWYIGPQFSTGWALNVPSSYGLVTVDTGVGDIALSSGPYRTTSNSRGLATLPVQAFTEESVRIEESSLPLGATPNEARKKIVVLPGQGAKLQLPIQSAGAFLKLPGLRTGHIVTVNGSPLPAYDFGVYVESLPLGENRMTLGKKTYRLRLDKPLRGLPTLLITEEVK